MSNSFSSFHQDDFPDFKAMLQPLKNSSTSNIFHFQKKVTKEEIEAILATIHQHRKDIFVDNDMPLDSTLQIYSIAHEYMNDDGKLFIGINAFIVSATEKQISLHVDPEYKYVSNHSQGFIDIVPIIEIAPAIKDLQLTPKIYGNYQEHLNKLIEKEMTKTFLYYKELFFAAPKPRGTFNGFKGDIFGPTVDEVTNGFGI